MLKPTVSFMEELVNVSCVVFTGRGVVGGWFYPTTGGFFGLGFAASFAGSAAIRASGMSAVRAMRVMVRWGMVRSLAGEGALSQRGAGRQ
jgi:hypothetical protein